MKNNIQVVNFDTCIKPARTSVLPLKAGQTFSAVSRERHPVTDNISIHLRSFISMNMSGFNISLFNTVSSKSPHTEG